KKGTAYNLKNLIVFTNNFSIGTYGKGKGRSTLTGYDLNDTIITFDHSDGGGGKGVNSINFAGGFTAIYVHGSFTGGIADSSFFNFDYNALHVSHDFTGSVKNVNFAYNDWCTYVGGDFCGDVVNSKFVSVGGGLHIEGSLYGPDGSGDFSDFGGTLFHDVKETSIYVGGSAMLGAFSGDAVFSENASSAMYFNNVNGDGEISIAATGGNTFYVQGGIGSNNERPNLKIKINPKCTHNGTVLFNRSHSDVWFSEAFIKHGTMVLQNGASFGSSENIGTFTVGTDATLRVAYNQRIPDYDYKVKSDGNIYVATAYYDTDNSGGSYISAGNVTIQGGLQFVVPEEYFLSPDYGNNSPALTIFGDAVIGNDVTVGIDVNSSANDGYNLLIAKFLGAELPVGKAFTLLQVAGKLTCDTPPEYVDSSSIPETSPGYRFDITLDSKNNRLLATFLGFAEQELSLEEEKPAGISLNSLYAALCEGHLARAAAVNRCGDLIASSAIDCAAQAAQTSGHLAPFSSFGWARERYKTGSHVKVRGPSVVAGAACSMGAPATRMVFGAFFEFANGSCETENSELGVNHVAGDGSCGAIGGGVLARVDLRKSKPHGFVLDGSFHGGSSDNKWKGGDLSTSYSSKGKYFGAHLGATYGLEIGKNVPISLYGKYLLSTSNGCKSSIGEAGDVEFGTLKSKRARIGGHAEIWSKGILVPWCDIYFEREFSGKAAIVGAGKIPSPSLRGNCAAGQIGITYAPSPIFIDLSLRALVGSKRGFGFDLCVGGEF
ncbi:MAG: hypothetical protein LBB38_04275, partial [Puniceicoccales bacterium]|nr:hypothetical protein [Puniceicoccales bacterium]